MQVKHNINEYSQTLHRTDLVTSCYLILFVSLLYYNNLLLTIWNFDNVYYVIAFLAAAEVTKYIVYATKEKLQIIRSIFDLIKGLSALFLIFTTYYVIAVLFGAPAFSQFEETVVFSLIATTVTALPACMHLGSKAMIGLFLSVMSHDGDPIHNLFMLKIRLSLLGAWLGAIATPLDWNRPWQNWPIPCCIGTLLGYVVASCVTSLLQFQQRGKLSKKTGKYIL